MEKTDEKKLQKTFEKRNFYNIGDAGVIFLLSLTIPLLVGIVVLYIGFVVFNLTGVALGENWISTIYNYVAFSVPYVIVSQLTLLSVFLIFTASKKISFSACKLKVDKSIDPLTAVLCALLGVVMVALFMPLMEGSMKAMFASWNIFPSAEILPLNNVGWLLFYIVFFAIMPAIAEELIFRGVIFNGVKKSMGSKWAIGLSALLFTLAHADIIKFVYPMIMGVFFAIVVDKTGNIFYTMLIHLFNNITTIVVQYLMNIGVFAKLNISVWFVIISIVLALVGVGVFLLFYFFVLKKRKYKNEEDVESNSSPVVKAKIPISIYIGIAISVLILVINMVPA